MSKKVALGTAQDVESRRDKYGLRTRDGHLLNDAVSALQKMIRRGRELEACYWAREIEHGHHPYLWRRLLCIASEDVGLGDPMAIAVTVACREAYFIVKAESRSDPSIHVIHCVLHLCRAKKNRETDALWTILDAKHRKGFKLEVPRCALDVYTKRGRDAGETAIGFWEHSSRLENEVPKDQQKWFYHPNDTVTPFPKDDGQR